MEFRDPPPPFRRGEIRWSPPPDPRSRIHYTLPYDVLFMCLCPPPHKRVLEFIDLHHEFVSPSPPVVNGHSLNMVFLEEYHLRQHCSDQTFPFEIVWHLKLKPCDIWSEFWNTSERLEYVKQKYYPRRTLMLNLSAMDYVYSINLVKMNRTLSSQSYK